MPLSPLLADLARARELMRQVDESQLDFAPDPTVSPDIAELTDLKSYPTESHVANLKARIAAVKQTEGQLAAERAPSDYVARLILACVKLSPPSDDYNPTVKRRAP